MVVLKSLHEGGTEIQVHGVIVGVKEYPQTKISLYTVEDIPPYFVHALLSNQRALSGIASC